MNDDTSNLPRLKNKQNPLNLVYKIRKEGDSLVS